MTPPSEPTAPSRRVADRCLACGEPLAHDQRYCLLCGARRGSLPTRIAAALREMSGRGAGGATPDEPVAAVLAREGGRAPASLLPLARAAAVSILLMLGVGAVFGAALQPGGVSSLAREVVLVVHHPSAPVPVASTSLPSAGAGGSGGAGAGVRSGGEGSSAGSTDGGGSASTGSGSGGGTGSGGSGSGTGAGGGSGSGSGSDSASKLPPIRHVWEIVLSDQGYAQSFGTTSGHRYLSKTLVGQGELITQYDAVASSPLANEIALISGQGPTEQTVQDCPVYADITPATTGTLGQVLGSGCLYPSSAQTLGQQLQVAGLSWRAYIQGIGSTAQRRPVTATTTPTTSATTPTTASPVTTTTTTTTTGSAPLSDTSTADACPHPAEGAVDDAQSVAAGDRYVTWKNPWVYFHSVVDDGSTCAHHDVGLAQLAKDLRRESATPAFSYVAADPCDDGSDTPCRPGARAGLAEADTFLHTVVPEIERSAAYRADGLILITFDEAPQSGPEWSTGSCCGQPTFPNLTATPPATSTATTATTTSTTSTTTTACSTATTTTGTTTTSTTSTSTIACAPAISGDPPGGGQVGLLMISPYVKPDTLNTIETYNHFSLLKSIENLFGVPHLGDTADKQVPAFVPSLFLASKR